MNLTSTNSFLETSMLASSKFFDLTQAQKMLFVPLAWAWRRGASEWSEWKADRFALDPDNLRIVSASENRARALRGRWSGFLRIDPTTAPM